MNDIVEAFHQYFEIVAADTPELLKEVFHLRYLVLCVHNTFPGIKASDYPDELEKDAYDCHSYHILLRHRSSDTYIGTARLIRLDPKNPEKLFPIELNTQFDPDFPGIENALRTHTAEISRFTILNDFFKRKKERRSIKAEAGIEDQRKRNRNRRRFPHPMLGLVVGILEMCVKYNCIYLLSAMDPALNRLLGFYGLQMDPIGPLTEYYGQRRPYHAHLGKVLTRMYLNHREIWELGTNYGKLWPAALDRRKKSRPSTWKISDNN